MTMTPKEILANTMADLGLTVESTFVPWSKSRNFKADAKITDRTLNWKVTLKRKGKEILTTDYSAGVGHAPGYALGRSRMTIEAVEVLKLETEHGKAVIKMGSVGPIWGGSIAPDACDVVHSLVLDADVLSYSSFEEWASNFGYDSDSRKAEAIYRACMAIALKLTNAVSVGDFVKLREACQDY